MNNISELLDKFAADERFVSHRELHQIARGAVGLVEERDRLRDEVERLKEENVQLKKQLCNYQLAEIGSKLVEEMEDDE